MEKNKEPYKIKLFTVILLIIIIILLAIIICGYYYINKENTINEGNKINEENVVQNSNDQEKNEGTYSNNTEPSSSNTTSIQEIDLNSDLIQNLYKYVVKYSDAEEVLVYQDKKVTAETMGNQLKLITIFNNIDESEASDIKTEELDGFIQVRHVLYKKETIENKAKQIFGNNVSILHESCTLKFGTQVNYKDGIYDYFNYQGGGGTYWEGSMAELSKAEKVEDEIYIYDKYIHIYEDTAEDIPENGIYADSNRKTKISELIDVSIDSTISKDQYEKEKFKQYETILGDKIKTYKHTFKKGINGSYYWYSTEPL